jgi:GGDEF domain-containing protein
LVEAATDQLTGTRTRLLGLDEVARELMRTRREPGAVLMLAFVDVDGLKQVNDSKGTSPATRCCDWSAGR